MTDLHPLVAHFLLLRSSMNSTPLDSLTPAERRIIWEANSKILKVLRGHPTMGQIHNDPRLRLEKLPGTTDPHSHPNYPAYGFGRTRRFILEPVEYAHPIVSLILRRNHSQKSLPPLDSYQIDFLHYFSFIDHVRPDLPIVQRNTLEPVYGAGLSLEELAFTRSELTSNQIIDKWVLQSETLYQDNGCEPTDVVPLCQFEFSTPTWIYTWREQNTNVEKTHHTSFISPSYQRDWNSPGLTTQRFGPSGTIHDSRLESAYSVLIDDHDRYLDHVVRDAPYRIDCSIRFEYDIDIDVALGGEVFSTSYRDYVWRNDPELTTSEIATYLIRRVMPDRYLRTPEGVGKSIMDKLTRRFFIRKLVQHDTQAGCIKIYKDFTGFEDLEFTQNNMRSSTRYYYQGWLYERSTGLLVSGGTLVTHGKGMRNPIEDTATAVWFHPGGKFKQKVWSMPFDEFKRDIIATCGSEWRPQLEDRLRWCYDFFPTFQLDLTGVPAIQRSPPPSSC